VPYNLLNFCFIHTIIVNTLKNRALKTSVCITFSISTETVLSFCLYAFLFIC
jgi:hypothetical protein